MIVNSIFIYNVGKLIDVEVSETITNVTREQNSNTLIITGCEFRNNYNDPPAGMIINMKNSDVSIIETNLIY